MTDDNEIIKTLKYCNWHDCEDCYCEYTNPSILANAALDLINRQRAEIKRLNSKLAAKDSVNYYNVAQLRIARNELNKYPIKTAVNNNCEIHSKTSKDYNDLISSIESGAIKAFAERLKKNIDNGELYRAGDYEITMRHIDNLVKEMTEGDINDR